MRILREGLQKEPAVMTVGSEHQRQAHTLHFLKQERSRIRRAAIAAPVIFEINTGAIAPVLISKITGAAIAARLIRLRSCFRKCSVCACR